MQNFRPTKIFYEPIVTTYAQGRQILEYYNSQQIPMEVILAHHKIESLKNKPYIEYPKMKTYLVLGTRKTIKLTANNKSADYIVPFTSSGCSAMCLYCYLMCHFSMNAYLRIFVNREEIMNKVEKHSKKIGIPKIYEIGCNSDMILENTITENLEWAIEKFARLPYATATFATKFHQVEPLLNLYHNGHTQMRISVNPEELIRAVEIGTSSLGQRIEAANQMYHAGYRVGINIAPIMMIEGYQGMYEKMFQMLHDQLDEGLKRQAFLEIIFMTYGVENFEINTKALPRAIDLFERQKMVPKGINKYTYNSEYRKEGINFIRSMVKRYLPESIIHYIV